MVMAMKLSPESFESDVRSGRPLKSRTRKIVERLQDAIEGNQRIVSKNLAVLLTVWKVPNHFDYLNLF